MTNKFVTTWLFSVESGCRDATPRNDENGQDLQDLQDDKEENQSCKSCKSCLFDERDPKILDERLTGGLKEVSASHPNQVSGYSPLPPEAVEVTARPFFTCTFKFSSADS